MDPGCCFSGSSSLVERELAEPLSSVDVDRNMLKSPMQEWRAHAVVFGLGGVCALLVGCERQLSWTLGLTVTSGLIFGGQWWMRNGRMLVKEMALAEHYVGGEAIEPPQVTFRYGLVVTAIAMSPAVALAILAPPIADGPISGGLLMGMVSCVYLVQKSRKLERRNGARLLWRRMTTFDRTSRRCSSSARYLMLLYR
jgi:hypothetical protein